MSIDTPDEEETTAPLSELELVDIPPGDEIASVPDDYRFGYIAIVGRPNVGKSTLLNRLVGQKVSITAHKPQTTRHQILGIHSTPSYQVVYVDTPGIHRGRRKAINRYMNRAATSAIEGVEAVVFVVEALQWTPEDEHIRRRLQSVERPVVLVPNKVDRITDKPTLLPYLAQFAEWDEFADVVPISARRGLNVDRLETLLAGYLPGGPPQFSMEQLTDRSERFLTAEIVREKLTRRLGQELPYQLTVEVEQFEVTEKITHISALIWVERKGHKNIVIGKNGHLLRDIGHDARVDMEVLLQTKVFLRLWVKVREGWSDDEKALRTLGYEAI
ncbi:MAG: GTP-binding protein Era [Gammaproteobacteria bacterium]|jgi:GTP-binding protein Era